MKEPSRRRRWALWLKAAVSVGLLVWLGARMLRRDGVEGLADRVGAIEPAWIAAAVALHFVAVFAGVSRWRLLLSAAKIELPFAWLLRSFLLGRFVGAFTPSTTGLDGWRLFEAGTESGQMSRSAAVIVLEKLVGLIAMGSVCAALVPLGGLEVLGPNALWWALALALGAALGVALMRSPGWLEAIVRRAPARLTPVLTKVLDAVRASRLSPTQLAGATARGVVSHVALSAVFVATAWAIGVEAPVGALLMVGNAIVLAVLLPVSIGGVGVREGVAALLLAGVGVGATDAVLVGLLGYLTGQVPALIGGGLMLVRRRRASPPLVTADSTLS